MKEAAVDPRVLADGSVLPKVDFVHCVPFLSTFWHNPKDH